MGISQPKTLFARTYLTLTVTLLLFFLLSAAGVIYFILVPVSSRAASDFASLIVLSAKTWAELPPGTRPDFERELAEMYEIVISPDRDTSVVQSRYLPYSRLLEAALVDRTGQSVSVGVLQRDGGDWFSAEIPVGSQLLNVSFPHARIGARPPVALVLVLLLGIALILLSSVYLVRRITVPITRLSNAIEGVGRGGEVMALPVSGPREIQALIRHFNKMNAEIATLLAGRSTLFAGISHDLRTPITRIQLALELLSKESESALVGRIRQDLEEMAQLISDTLDLSKGLAPHKHETIDIYQFISSLTSSLSHTGGVVTFKSKGKFMCAVDTLALRRVLTNLIENAQRYSENSGVEVYCDVTESVVNVQILDRGVGIPEAECEAVFQPFYRREQSRSRATGGSGLGLAIVKHLCDSNAWKIKLMPRDGGGTQAELTFSIGSSEPEPTRDV